MEIPSSTTGVQSRSAFNYALSYLCARSTNSKGCIGNLSDIFRPRYFLAILLLFGSTGSIVKIYERLRQLLSTYSTGEVLPHFTTIHVVQFLLPISNFSYFYNSQGSALGGLLKSAESYMHTSEENAFCFRTHTRFLVTWKCHHTILSFSLASELGIFLLWSLYRDYFLRVHQGNR